MTDPTGGQFPWQGETPEHDAHGFRLVGGNVTVLLGYAAYRGGILLYSLVQIGDQQYKPWRRHWASREAAVESAESLAGDAYEYITETLGQRPREIEDLDLDDFVEHVRLRTENAFH